MAAVISRQAKADEPHALPDHPTFGKIERLVPDKLNSLLAEDVKLEKLAEGFNWSEGPVWNREGFLIFSDIPRNRAMKWQDDRLSIYLELLRLHRHERARGETGSNGLTMDHQGRLVLCQHGDRRIARARAGWQASTPLVEKFAKANDSTARTIFVSKRTAICISPIRRTDWKRATTIRCAKWTFAASIASSLTGTSIC